MIAVAGRVNWTEFQIQDQEDLLECSTVRLFPYSLVKMISFFSFDWWTPFPSGRQDAYLCLERTFISFRSLSMGWVMVLPIFGSKGLFVSFFSSRRFGSFLGFLHVDRPTLCQVGSCDSTVAVASWHHVLHCEDGWWPSPVNTWKQTIPKRSPGAMFAPCGHAKVDQYGIV